VVVTGKGGVGKSTVAAALGLAGVRAGRHTIVVEVSDRHDVARALGGSPSAGEEELVDGLHHLSVDPQAALEEYLRDQLASRMVSELMASSRTFAYLTAATPGLHELLMIGKVWDLAQDERRTPGPAHYDLVILDAPSSGHALAVLRSPRTFGAVARAGPIARQARAIDAMLSDPARTGVVLVARPEEMPVNETLELKDALQAEMGLGVDLAVVNAVLPNRFSAREARALAAAPRSLEVGAALAAHERARAQQAQLARLRRQVAAPVATLPFVFSPALAAADLKALSGRLERAL
jgi:anion-transporting  ArsA/GET3 family ATPase